ncbi:MAG: glycosyltransferase [Sphingobacteriaceae bacterium]|nr:MAG: glycosyltransferase [Sphingobacteriaceae bacterium]
MEVTLPYILLALFLLCFIIQLYFLISQYAGFKKSDIQTVDSDPQLPVSVIICARNEAENLRQNLPAILNQNYPDFEVVVVNDCSTDDSSYFLDQLKTEYNHLKVVTVTEHRRFKTGKKFALTMGIKAAKNEHLLLTDADCLPVSANWVALMQQGFSAEKQIVLGYSPYKKTSGFLNTFVRFETVKTACSYLSAALNKNPYMGVGRNLAYTKSLFFGAKGFAAHMHLLSGDDDLFVNQNANAVNTTVQINAEAHTFSETKTNLRAYYRQKKRHMGVGKYYKIKNRVLITFDALSGILFYILLVVLLCLKIQPVLVVGLYSFRLILQCFFYPAIFRKLDAADLIWKFPLLDLFYYLYLNVFGMVGLATKNLKWK